MANAIGVNKLRLVAISRSINAVMLTARTSGAGMNMFMLMTVAMGVVMAMIMGAALNTCRRCENGHGHGRDGDRSRLDTVAASTLLADQARDAIVCLLSKCEPLLQNCPSACAKIARLQASR
jgi:hypothetical protein